MNDRDFIQFLGTGAGDCFELYPPEGSEVNGVKAKKSRNRNVRHAPSLFISPDMLVDFFGSAQMQAYGIRDESIHHLLITHAHEDHFQPKAILDVASGLPHPWTVYGNTTVKHALDFASVHRWNASTENFELIEKTSEMPVQVVQPGQRLSVGEVKVIAVSANHMIDVKHLIQQEQALNYVFERGEKTLFYGLDSSYVLPETQKILSGFQFDIAVFDATFGLKEIDPFQSGHQNFAMLEKTITQFWEANLFKEDAILVADHISYYEVEPYNEIVNELSEKGIVLAYDGMILEF
jgi:phosphoribosyl 1,2-cyclic phosphate phosphodiesterase